MRAKTTRAFRTISEAGDELGLQPHVLRFWESKFSDIKPIKRGGGRRFYRPEDIEFLRGIKTLLYDEKHPIKDVQKLIAKSGANRIIELGRSVEQASRERDITETTLVPERIEKPGIAVKPDVVDAEVEIEEAEVEVEVVEAVPVEPDPVDVILEDPPAPPPPDLSCLEDALSRLKILRQHWDDFDAGKDA
ncbi:MAG: MerR family transcriptional regulator [Pseudomonadota bacterium]